MLDTANAEIEGFLDDAGCGDIDHIEPLAGGANNRVFRIKSERGEFALKQYFSDAGDPRNRLGSEYDFCALARDCGLSQAPRPIARDRSRHLGLYEYIHGRRLSPDEIGEAEVQQALNFFIALNAHREKPAARTLGPASEAFFSISGQLGCVEGRIERLLSVRPDSPARGESAAFVQEHLAPAWRTLVRDVRAAALRDGETVEQNLTLDQRCLSPSDFGFHNALREESGRLRFIDFEYAGWDDPAKTMADFFCQPAVPAPWSCLSAFVDSVAKMQPSPQRFLKRVSLLFPVYQIKWCCIMLNGILPLGARRRAFAAGRKQVEIERDLSVQLQKARDQLSRLRSPANEMV